MTQYLTSFPTCHGHVPTCLRRQHGQLSLLRLTRNTYMISFNVYKKKGLTSHFQISNYKFQIYLSYSTSREILSGTNAFGTMICKVLSGVSLLWILSKYT